MNWFKKSNKTYQPKVEKSILKNISYPPKIILAWTKAMQGNTEISKWLNDNGYKELVFASAAIHLKEDARQWLMKNGYAHLMAMINASEGDENAQKWLLKFKFELLYHIAMISEYQNDSMIWLKRNGTPDLFLFAIALRDVKDKIEDNHNDIHSHGKDY